MHAQRDDRELLVHLGDQIGTGRQTTRDDICGFALLLHVEAERSQREGLSLDAYGNCR